MMGEYPGKPFTAKATAAEEASRPTAHTPTTPNPNRFRAELPIAHC
jgi:hypothetical protein